MYPTVSTLAKIAGINSRSKRSWAPLYCSDAEKATLFTSGISQVVSPHLISQFSSGEESRQVFNKMRHPLLETLLAFAPKRT